jgi:hypothetical protein
MDNELKTSWRRIVEHYQVHPTARCMNITIEECIEEEINYGWRNGMYD